MFSPGKSSTGPDGWKRETTSRLQGAYSEERMGLQTRDGARVAMTDSTAAQSAVLSASQLALQRELSREAEMIARLEASLHVTVTEQEDLAAGTARCQAALDWVLPSVALIEATVAARDRRPQRELTLDGAGIALRDQRVDVAQSLQLLRQVLGACATETDRLAAVIRELEGMLALKKQSSEVDTLTLEGPASSPDRHSRSTILPYRWAQTCEQTMERAKAVRAVSERVRGKSLAAQADSRKRQVGCRARTIGSVQERIGAAESLIAALVERISQTGNENAAVEDAVAELEGQIDGLVDPLALALSRLTARTNRPATERLRDGAERALEAEVEQLKRNSERLEDSRRNADLRSGALKDSLDAMHRDMEDKNFAVSCEREAEGLQLGLECLPENVPY